jgi:predicted TIM-barrel fold metal-dependent hydrolase
VIIDIHCHPFGNAGCGIVDRIKARRDAVLLRKRDPRMFAENWGTLNDETAPLIEDMAANGIDKAIIQPSIGEGPEMVAEAVKRNPDKFIGCFMTGSFDFYGGPNSPDSKKIFEKPDIGRFRETVKYNVEELKLKGMGEIAIGHFTRESSPNEIAKDLMPMMEVLAKYRMPVMFPTAWTQFGTRLYHGLPLFIDDLAERFPDVPIVLVKMGRGYSFIYEMCLAVAFKHENIFLETSQARPEHIRQAVSELGADRVVFGTDWTGTWRALYAKQGGIYKANMDVIDAAGITAEQKSWVCGRTTAKMFNIS